jgi:hypothetical protein
MIFSVAAPSALNPSGTTTVSVAKKKMTKKQVKKAYKKIKKGMTKKQVKKILGKLGKKIQDSFDSQEYSMSWSWGEWSYINIHVNFWHGKLDDKSIMII